MLPVAGGQSGPPARDHCMLKLRKRPTAPYALLALGLLAACAGPSAPPASGYLDDYTLVGEANFLSGYPAVNSDGTVNVVVEIPAGTNAKWEVDKRDGTLRWEFEHGRPRVVAYVGYPGNYGMVPRTLLPADEGGDGDPLDVLVIGAHAERGTVQRCHILGVLALLDGGEVDDKLLAVAEGNALSELRDLEQLDARFPGVREIVETWFVSYKGPGELVARGWSGPERAQEILDVAVRAYAEAESER